MFLVEFVEIVLVVLSYKFSFFVESIRIVIVLLRKESLYRECVCVP